MNLIKTIAGRPTPFVYLISAALAVSLAGCAGAGTPPPAASNPTAVTATAGAPIGQNSTTTVDEATNPATINATSFRAKGPQPVLLGTAGAFVILAKTGISTTGTTSIVGDIGVSPAARTYITGFSNILDASGQFAKSIYVNGKIYAANMAVPTPAKMTTAISNMETAYTDAAGRSRPDFTEKGAGNISGLTLTPGLYKWGTGVLMTSNVTLAGGPNDVWIFQVAAGITVGSGAKVILSGGAVPKNIFWQTAGAVTLGSTSVFKGVILGKTKIAMNAGAVLDGRALAQTAVTLIANTVTQPAP